VETYRKKPLRVHPLFEEAVLDVLRDINVHEE